MDFINWPYTIGLAGVFATLYCANRGWTTLATILVIVLIIASGIYSRDDGCYVDWDGRSNPVVCD